MEELIILEEKDASDWIYRGEGAANLILSYTASSNHFVGKVLRVPKLKKNETICEELTSYLSEHECLLWKEDCDLLSAPTRDIAKHLYVQYVMCPLLGSNHVDAGIRILVSKEFLKSVEKNTISQRPSWRVDQADVNTQCDYALLMSDHSVFPQSLHGEEFSISVEIKPKCGFLPCSRYIAEDHTIKRSISRFKLHQNLKLQQKKVSQLSQYDPLDMFSGSRERIMKSVKDLFSTPQNNFRVFLNGSLVFGSLGGGELKTNAHNEKAFEEVLTSVIQADDGMRTACFLELVSEAVSKSGLMDRLLQAQKLDAFDIEGAIHAFYDAVSQPCVVCKELGEDKLSGRFSSLHSLPLDGKLKIVRDYLIAATAKDLSMMISFRMREKRDPKSPYNVIFHESTGQTFDYKVSFIDLDMKPLEKMTVYYELDQKILRCYTKMMKTAKRPKISPGVVDISSYQEKSMVVEDDSPTRDSAVIGA